MAKESLRVGVVGMGKMGLLHSGLINVLPDTKLTVACEPANLTRRLLKKALPKVPVVKDVSEMSKYDLDALFITTPTRTHYDVCKTALQNGIAHNLFVEKPLSGSYQSSIELSNMMSSSGIGLVGYVRRFMVTFLKARELLKQGLIGDPTSFSLNLVSSDFCGVKDPAVSINRGGVLKDLGCYAIDLILWYFGDFQVDSASAQSLTGPGAVDAVQFKVLDKNAVPPGNVFVSWCVEGYRMPEADFSIVGSKGKISVNDDFVKLDVEGNSSTFYRLNLNDITPFWLGAPEYFREDEAFAKAVKNGGIVEPSFASAAKVELQIDELERRFNQK